MAYAHHPSTFDPIIAILAAIADPTDPGQVEAVIATVTGMLTDRFPEETEGEGDMRIDFAFKRIDGSIADLRQLRRLAVHAVALAEFVELVDSVIAEATTARDAAPAGATSPTEAGPQRAAWATARLPVEPWSPVPDWLRDI